MQGKGNKVIFVLFLALFFSFLSWGNRALVLPPGEWVEIESENYNYFIQVDNPGDLADYAGAVERLECFYMFMLDAWPLPEDFRINYYKYKSRDSLYQVSGREVSGLAVLGREVVHSIYEADVHEVSHLITTSHITGVNTGKPVNIPLFWLEGIAMYYTWPRFYFCYDENPEYHQLIGSWHGSSVHCIARRLLLQNELPALGQFIDNDIAFKDCCSHSIYPAAGSFVTYFLGPGHTDLEAISLYRLFLQQIHDHWPQKSIEELFAEGFGTSLKDVEQDWQLFLQDWDFKTMKCDCSQQ